MNKYLVRFLVLIPFLFTSTTFAWTIEEFNFEADIKNDGSVIITETITADFRSSRNKHGIIRDIPTQYKNADGETIYTPISQVTVTDENDRSRKVRQSSDSDEISLKIGDANRNVQSEEVYRIRYTVLGALNAFEDHDEFYWNVTGNGWDTDINKVAAIVRLPQSGNNLKGLCYTGRQGSTEQNCAYKISDSGDAAGFKTNRSLRAGEGLTLVFGWDKGLVAVPDRLEKPIDPELEMFKNFILGRELSDEANFFRVLLGWILGFQFFVIFIHIFRFQSRKIKKSIIPKYHPPNNISLSESGLIYDHKFGPKDITALIVSLCVKKHMIIKQETKEHVWFLGTIKTTNYTFAKTLTPQSKTPLTAPEQLIYDGIFFNDNDNEITLNDLRTSWARKAIFKPKNLRALKVMVEKLAHDNDIKIRKLSSYNPFPQLTGFIYRISFIVLLIIALVYNSVWALAIFILIYIVPILFIPLMVVLPFFKILTPKGTQAYHDLKCFAEYMKVAEKDRLEWSEAQGLFEEYLPYAITFGLTHKWVKKFNIDLKTPNWYQSDDTNFNMSHFTSSLSAIGSSVSAASSNGGSSGFSGGSSGGGGGGGGGSSW